MSGISEGDRVLLFAASGEKTIVRAEPGLKKVRGIGVVDMGSIVGKEYGSTIVMGDRLYYLMRPSIVDTIETIERRAQIILPKDSALIAMYCDVRSGCRVLEAGTGSGGLTVVLAGLVAPDGMIVSYDNRRDHQSVAARNIEQAGVSRFVTLKEGDVNEGVEERGMDAMVLDVPEPWLAAPTARQCLRPGGHLACYSPTATQVDTAVRTLRGGGFIDIISMELIMRHMVVGELGIRPSHDMLGHTGYLTFARRSGD